MKFWKLPFNFISGSGRIVLAACLLASLLSACSPVGRSPATALPGLPTASQVSQIPSPWATLTPTFPPTARPTQESTSVLPNLTPTALPNPRPLSFSVEHIPAPALRGNLLGDPEEQAVEIYLPPSYATSELRYPVVYFLPGFGSSTEGDNEFFSPGQVGELMSRGQLKEMILVVPNGTNSLGGSFYVNSEVTGNWEDYITRDLVGYIDSHYRTIRSAAGRGIGGHSMGGFGALNLAMRHPADFGAVYSLSPGLFDESGLGDSHMFDDAKKPRSFLEHQRELNELPPEEAILEMIDYEGALGFTVAYGAAFAPNPGRGAPFFDYPYRQEDGEIKRVPRVWKQWQAGLGDWAHKIEVNQGSLARLRGIVIDYGVQDVFPWIPRGSEYVSQQLQQAGINNQLNRFDGGHTDQIQARLLQVGLPFFSRVLASPRSPASVRRAPR